MLGFVSPGASLRAAALTTIFALATASTSQAATTLVRPARGAVGSPQWFVSHLGASNSTRSAAIPNGSTAAYPLDAPSGLTVAPNGDLYVANLLANQVLVYGSNLVQKTGSTIAAGLSHPTGVAFDSSGNLFVSNMGSNAINVYSPGHALIANRTITSNINKPAAIAIDGMDNLYVNEDYAAVGLYSYLGFYQTNIPLSPALGTVNAMSARGPFFVVGGGNLMTFGSTEVMLGIITFNLTNYVIPVTGVPVNDALGVASDGNHNVYEATDDPAIVFINTQQQGRQTLASLSFVPAAIAVDSINNHVFVANLYGNAIAVYTLAGHYLTTLH